MNIFLSFDQRLSAFFRAWAERNEFTRRLAVLGASELIWVLVGMVGVVLLWEGDLVSALSASAFVVPAILLPWAVTLGLEALIRRARPFEQTKTPALIQMSWKTASFPSGHATLAFSFAVLLAILIPTFAVIFFLLAAWIALARVMVGVHFVSDVIVGALIGAVGTFATYALAVLYFWSLSAF